MRKVTRKQWTARGALLLMLLALPVMVEEHGLPRALAGSPIAFATNYFLIYPVYVVVRAAWRGAGEIWPFLLKFA